jgi:hypothetical protein
MDGKGLEQVQMHPVPFALQIRPAEPSDPRSPSILLPNELDVLVVMSCGRRFNHPAFHCRAEFVEAMCQFLEVRKLSPVLP